MVDGCSHYQIFYRIILPLLQPALATTAIFTFIWTWNDFFTQLIYLGHPDIYTVPVSGGNATRLTSGMDIPDEAASCGVKFSIGAVPASRESAR